MWPRERVDFVRSVVVLGVCASLAWGGFAQETVPPDDSELSDLSLEELLDLPIVSASNTSERLSDAPATVIVITAQQLRERGYTELSQIFDDLPGMEVVRPYGDTYLKNYWRGYRNTIGDPYLVLVDGVVMNHLYFNTADVLVTLPMSNVDRVEVVYGPASSVYGANAFMGVVNVITRRQTEQGSSGRAMISAGSFDQRSADVTYGYSSGDLHWSLTGRFDNGDIDPDVAERYEYTKKSYLSDRRLWGGFVDNAAIAGEFASPRRNRALDLRAQFGGLEAALQYFVFDSGYGVEYANDRAQTRGTWKRPDLSAHLRATHELAPRLRSRTLLRYRRSDVENDSFFVARATGDGEAPLVDFSYWQSLNASWSLLQDFDWRGSDRLALTAGIKYEQKDLQKAYDLAYGPSLSPVDVDASSYPYPTPPTDSSIASNRTTTEDEGVYVQGWYSLTKAHRVNVGVRWDSNSQYGEAVTLRAGYVGSRGPWRFKALYGEAFQEPNPRLLYGGWTGSGSDPDLAPEESRTVEVSAAYSTPRTSALISLYDVNNDDTIVNTATGAENLGDRSVTGVDLHLQFIGRTHWSRQLKSWLYYSRIIDAEELQYSTETLLLEPGRIGDLADDKLMAGITWYFNPTVNATLRGRYIGERDTVQTNPVDTVPSFTTLDASFVADRVANSRIGVTVSAHNLTDEQYYHPGVRDANAGTTAGFFDDSGAWHGSGGFYNSLLPQPGRSISIALTLDLR